jgi:hypothetical protein
MEDVGSIAMDDTASQDAMSGSSELDANDLRHKLKMRERLLAMTEARIETGQKPMEAEINNGLE